MTNLVDPSWHWISDVEELKIDGAMTRSDLRAAIKSILSILQDGDLLRIFPL